MGSDTVLIRKRHKGDGLMKKIICIIALLLFAGIAHGAPTLTANDRTVLAEQSCNFSFTSSEAFTTAHFFLNGVENTTSNSYYVYTMPEEGEYYNVSVFVESANGGSDMLYMRGTVPRTLANTTLGQFSETEYVNLAENLEKGDWEGLLGNSMNPFEELMGKSVYIILFLLPFGLMWKRQEFMTIPVVVSMIIGCIIIGFIPEQYKTFIILMIILSFAVNLYMLGRDRN